MFQSFLLLPAGTHVSKRGHHGKSEAQGMSFTRFSTYSIPSGASLGSCSCPLILQGNNYQSKSYQRLFFSPELTLFCTFKKLNRFCTFCSSCSFLGLLVVVVFWFFCGDDYFSLMEIYCNISGLAARRWNHVYFWHSRAVIIMFGNWVSSCQLESHSVHYLKGENKERGGSAV